MSAIDPFSYPAEHDVSFAAERAALAASRLELASDQLDEVGNRQGDRRSDETLLCFAELNIQRAQAGAMLAIAHELTELRSHMPQVVGVGLELNQLATAVDGLAGAVDYRAEPRPRWWQRRIRRALRTAAKPQETAQ
ncbi:hypothetical protein [Streptomyces sp.]|uniref:hypothetical protein n=1 Tax=Streptomyces sp. TaxID=1931 RepID=UPI002F95C8B2